MSQLSSVATSRVDSKAQSKAPASNVSIRSGVSRVSGASVQGTQKSSMTAKYSNITEFLENALTIDEYGYTDKDCRNCGEKLTFDEVLAFAVPLDSQGRSRVDLAKLDMNNLQCICLGCYADIVSVRNEKQRVSPVPSARNEAGQAPQKNQSNLSSKAACKPPSADHVVNPFSQFRRMPPKPQNRPRSKSPVESVRSNITYSKRANSSKGTDKGQDYRFQQGRPLPVNRKKTDITYYANAMFAGGVFANSLIPGSSI